MNAGSLELSEVGGLNRIPLREQVSVKIKQLILTNRLPPGQPLVIDRLASELGVSHTPVREALAALAREGLVTMPQYGSPRVTGIERRDVEEVWDMRLLLEGWAAAQASQVISDEAIDRIDELLERARQDAEVSNYDTHLDADLELHEMITGSIDNDLFKHLMSQVEDRSERIRWLVETSGGNEEVLDIIEEHCAIVRALRSHDPEAIRRQLKAHLEAGKERTLSAIDRLERGELEQGDNA